MKLTTTILALVMLAAAAGAQSTDAGKPSPVAPAPAIKPALIAGAKAAAPSKTATPSENPSSSEASNMLDGVSVKRSGDDVQIEIKSREAVTPKVSKLSSPARILVELPETAMATSQSKIAVGSSGVKGVRIGMNGKTPPTTSVVVDLEQPSAYEMKPGPGNSFVLTLHTQTTAAKAAPAPAKATAPAPKLQTAAMKPQAAAPSPKSSAPAPMAVAAKPVAAQPVTAKKNSAPAPAQAKTNSAPATALAKPHDVFMPKQSAAPAPGVAVAKTEAKPGAPGLALKIVAAKAETKPVASAGAKPVIAAREPAPAGKAAVSGPAKASAEAKPAETEKTAEAPKPPKPEEKKWAMTGKRDPFFSPVVQQPTGSGCSTGKKCLEIGQINVRGVVKSENGFIAVVTNSLNKAYFLHENDPVFNGYVLRITGDSVVFQETVQDQLGKPVTREVVKRIVTPAV